MESYDLILFAGQSNMAGRGITSEQWPQQAPKLIRGAGYEYRAITDPDRLWPIEEPFGVNENNPDGIYEPGMKTGSMVTAFVNAYYEKTGMPILAVSASKGGSAIGEWQGNEDYLSDAISRLKKAVSYAKEKKLKLRHKYVVWCQGETDGDHNTPTREYKQMFDHMMQLFKKSGVEKCFLITIGEYNGSQGYEEAYHRIRQAQIEITLESDDVRLVCDEFCHMKERGLMKDDFHYFQQAYNEAGTEAGKRVAEYVLGSNE